MDCYKTPSVSEARWWLHLCNFRARRHDGSTRFQFAVHHQSRRSCNSRRHAHRVGITIFWHKNQQRVHGPTLMLKLCARAAEAGHRVFFYGSRPETLHHLIQNLVTKFPQLKIVGMCPDPFHPSSAEEDTRIRQLILRRNCELLFVGIGESKQNRCMADHLNGIRMAVPALP
jgi:Glycosyl transferase WecG/TagA/CpsF family